mmetsp:Transcript_36027/g.87495  ORF Transcript_36027/g.87495 Transcript_36027/m.87495 type:complete len:267 (+) Transcript_36027:216-1016(+)
MCPLRQPAYAVRHSSRRAPSALGSRRCGWRQTGQRVCPASEQRCAQSAQSAWAQTSWIARSIAPRQTGHVVLAPRCRGRYCSLHESAATARCSSGGASIPASARSSRVCAPYLGAWRSGTTSPPPRAERTAHGANMVSAPTGWWACARNWKVGAARPTSHAASGRVWAARREASEASGTASTPARRSSSTHSAAGRQAKAAARCAAIASSASAPRRAASIAASAAAAKAGWAAARRRSACCGAGEAAGHAGRSEAQSSSHDLPAPS